MMVRTSTRLTFFLLSFALFLGTFIGHNFAQATITLVSVSGYSGIQPGITTPASGSGTTATPASSTAPIIFGGTAGMPADGSCPKPVAGGFCNSCSGGLTACNTQAVLSTTNFTITISTNQTAPTLPGVNVTASSGGTTSGAVAGVSISPSATTGANQNVTFTIPWSQICNYATPSGTTPTSPCLVDGTVTLSFVFNSTTSTGSVIDSFPIQFVIQNSMCDTVYSSMNTGSPTCTEGIDFFNLGDGDAKVYVGDVSSQNGSFPKRASGNLRFTTARFFYQTLPFDPVANDACNTATGAIAKVRNTSPFIDNPIHFTVAGTAAGASDQNGTLDNEYLSGVQNGVAYAFKIALVDQASNVGYFTADGDCGDYAHTAKTTLKVPFGNHVAHPSPVSGLLTNTLNCFVATAAYGSPMSPFVQVLRDFRDQYLIPNRAGAHFVQWYYEHSPNPAHWISEHPLARKVTQVALWPAVGFAWASVNYGMPTAIALSIFAVIALISILKLSFRVLAGLGGLAIWTIVIIAIGSSVFFFGLKSDAATTHVKLPRAPAASGPDADTAPREAPYTQPQDDDANLSPTATNTKPSPTDTGWKDWKDPFAPTIKKNNAAAGGDPASDTEWRRWQDPFQKKNAETSDLKNGEAPSPQSENPQWREWNDPFKGKKETNSETQYPKSLNQKTPVANETDQAPSELSKEKGVQRITKKGEYKYGLPQPVSSKSASFRFGSFPPPANLSNGTLKFSDVYGSSASTVLVFDYQWNISKKFGILAFKLGSGIFVAQGHGHFVDNSIPRPNGAVAQELYTFALFPNSASLVYRFKYTDKQLFVPYLDGGLDYYTFAEIRDDGVSPKFGGSPLGHGTAGIAIALDGLSPKSMLDLDRDYGISHVYLTAEFRASQSLGGSFDFSGTLASAGFAFDF